MNEIELLYFDGCPSWQTALDNLQQVIQAEKISSPVRMLEITDPQQAQDEHFLGSSSFRMNGVDFWPETRSRYYMSCRVYNTDQGLQGFPTIEMLRERLRAILNEFLS